MDGLRIDREQIPVFARVLRDLDQLCVVVCDMQSAHKSRTNHIGITYESRKTRVRVAWINFIILSFLTNAIVRNFRE